MKKFFTFFAALLMAGGMMAVDVTFGNAGLNDYVYYEEDSYARWYLSWKPENSPVVSKVMMERTGNLENKFGHFTTADFNLFQSSIMLKEGSEPYLSDIDITLTETETGFTMTGYVAANGVTYNVNGVYSAPVGVASITTFSSLEDLEGMTVTFTGGTPTREAGYILLKDSTERVIYAYSEDYSISNNVLTINSFDTVLFDFTLPEEEMDMKVIIYDVFEDYAMSNAGTIHYNPNPADPEELKLYIIGDIQGWNPAQGIEMTAVEDSVFTYNYVRESEGYFSFTTIQGDWDSVNAHRFSPAADGTVAVEGDNDLFAGTVAFKIAGGDYTFTVNVSTMKLNVVNNAQAILNVLNVKTQKAIENGQVVILRDGKKFNLMGIAL